MTGSSDEDLALGYTFLKFRQDKAVEQKKKLKKLDKKLKRMKKLSKFKKR